MIEDEAEARARISALGECAEVHDIPFEERRMRWRRIGNGPALLLVHGGQGSWLHWARNIDALSAKFTLWLPDLPGLGDSEEIPDPQTLDRLVAALRHGLDVLAGPDTDVRLAAFSFGAALAAGMAAVRGHVTHFAMIGGTGHGLPRRQAELRKWRDLPKGPIQDEAHRHNLSQQMLWDTASIDALALVVHREAMHRTRLRSRPISRSAAMRLALDRLALPILMIWGEHDPTALGVTTAHVLAEGHSNREWQIVPGASHWVQYERPELINQLLLRWFGAADGAGSRQPTIGAQCDGMHAVEPPSTGMSAP